MVDTVYSASAWKLLAILGSYEIDPGSAIFIPGRFRTGGFVVARPYFAAWSELLHVTCTYKFVHVFTGQRYSNRQTSTGYSGSCLGNGNPETPGHDPNA